MCGGELHRSPGAGVEGSAAGAVRRAGETIDMPAGQGAHRGCVDLYETGGAVVEIDEDAGEVVAVARPDVAAELSEDSHGFGGMEQSPELIDEVAAPVVEASAAEAGLVAPAGARFFCRRAVAACPFAEAAFNVDASAGLVRWRRLSRG